MRHGCVSLANSKEDTLGQDFGVMDFRCHYKYKLSHYSWSTAASRTINVKPDFNSLGFILGGRGGGGNLGVIVVRVFEPVFRNLPHSYTWPLKKRTHSYTRSSEMLAHSYTAL